MELSGCKAGRARSRRGWTTRLWDPHKVRAHQLLGHGQPRSWRESASPGGSGRWDVPPGWGINAVQLDRLYNNPGTISCPGGCSRSGRTELLAQQLGTPSPTALGPVGFGEDEFLISELPGSISIIIFQCPQAQGGIVGVDNPQGVGLHDPFWLRLFHNSMIPR